MLDFPNPIENSTRVRSFSKSKNFPSDREYWRHSRQCPAAEIKVLCNRTCEVVAETSGDSLLEGQYQRPRRQDRQPFRSRPVTVDLPWLTYG
eukprot:3193344-Amphidinium_carterae.1